MVHKVPTAEIKGEPTIRGGFLENPAQVDMAGLQKMPAPECDRHPSPSDPGDQGRVLLGGQKSWPLKLGSFSLVLTRASFAREAMSATFTRTSGDVDALHHMTILMFVVFIYPEL